MRSTMWIYIMVVFFSKSWSLESVNRKQVFNLGSSVNLTCSSRTWKDTLYVIWNLDLKHKTCRISYCNEGENVDTCNDGKLLQNTTAGQSYLHIPNISADDVGLYWCESVYVGGNDNYKINVTITVPPTLSAWLERRGNEMLAMCRAEGGYPAANISWSLTGNSESVKTLPGSDGFVTVESELELLEGMNPENLSCIVRHQSWDQERSLVPQPREGQDSAREYKLWIFLLVIGVLFVLLAAFIVLVLKKVKLSRRCQHVDTPNKSPTIEDVEEVEPYASYVQRVNSIYN
ncbi:cell surface glycoprotein CD200 receptor 1-A [Nothobranchius furzeri]|uniref:CD200 receptor 1-like n=1 Tax=Nothobranchius furzeri TaxID=105023 RepID=A0A1A8B6B5_NOTFU|nr:cell surface glycoprotein CD200 receptor 1-A isoform X1 [Nothobranchius furzeri]KAF7215671.1 transcript variant X1 [Nothobranchius furzeri]